MIVACLVAQKRKPPLILRPRTARGPEGRPRTRPGTTHLWAAAHTRAAGSLLLSLLGDIPHVIGCKDFRRVSTVPLNGHAVRGGADDRAPDLPTLHPIALGQVIGFVLGHCGAPCILRLTSSSSTIWVRSSLPS